ncbi:YhdP family protein [uncultured Microbulbifer sp.]|uniref:YhdP family protein n=1 Tax=uncultured Microbulbifer sp. TaxID=348147 RepID=UPI0025D6C6EA|nr:YhdP family protein [uncultured Microbulbifer sp.]
MRWLRWCVRKFWLLVVSIVIALAILVQTGRVLSPQVGNYSPQIGHWLSQRLGAPVSIGGISLRWQALEVALQVDGLKMGAGEEVHLGRGLFHLDLLASLWHRELIWKNLEVDDFSADLQQRDDGGWQVVGFPISGNAGTAQADSGGVRIGDPARIFQLGPKVLVRNARIGLALTDGQSAELELPRVLLENSGMFHRLTARAYVSGAMENLHSGEESLRLVLEGRGNPRHSEDFTLHGYVQLNDLLVDRDLVALLYRLSPLPEKLHWYGRKIAGGRLWLASDATSGYSLRGQLNLSQMPEERDEQSSPAAAATSATAVNSEPTAKTPTPTGSNALASLQSLSSNLSGQWQPGESWGLVLQQLSLNWEQLEVPELNLRAGGDRETGAQLALDQIELKAWHQVLRVLELVPEKADEWLEALEPEGQLRNVRLARRPDGELTLAANLHQVAAGAHRGAPAVSGVNGYLALDGKGGRVELDSPAGFSAHFPLLYDQPFQFASARGTVAWSLDAAHNEVSVYSGPLALQSDKGKFGGQFLLQLPLVPHTRPSDFTLALGLEDVAVAEQRNLVPTVVSDDLRNWLNQGIGANNRGHIRSAGFVYRGYGYKEGEDTELLALGSHPGRQTVQLQADFEDSDLDYAPGWPRARQIDGHLAINDAEVVVNAPRARLWNIDASALRVTVAPQQRGSRLDVRADLSGPAADGLRLLRESPLREQLGSAFDDWALGGRLDGELRLTQGLGGAAIAPQQQVDLSLSEAQLALENLRLEFQSLNGEVHYSSDAGLTGTALTGRLWNQPLKARIQHLGQGDERDTQVVVEGAARAEDIGHWSGRPELTWLNGALDYSALVTIPARAKAKPYAAVLEINSDLKGVAVDLPVPLGKTAEEESRFVLRVPIGEQGNLYHLSYGEHLQGQFWQVGNRLERASIALNAQAKLPKAPGVSIIGDLSVIELQPWKQALAIYGEQPRGDGSVDRGAVPSQSAQADEPPMAVTLDLSTDSLNLSDSVQIENIHVRGRGLGADWQLEFDSETAAGAVTGILDAATPLQLNLRHLRLPAMATAEDAVPEGAESEAEVAAQSPLDRWRGFDFAGLPQVDFKTQNLQVGEESMGPWSFQLRPSPERLVVSDIRGSLRGVQIEGRGEGENRLGAQLMWMRNEQGRESSQFIGRLSGGNLGQVLQAWGQEAVIESTSASFDTALRWDGSPANASADGLSGEIRIDIRQGRFLRASDNAGTSLLRLLSLFNFDTWARRLRLDFSDLVQSGLTFDRVHGEVYFEGDGELLIAVPIQVEGPTSELQMAGRVNIKREDLNLTLVATLPVGNNLAFVAALAGGLPAAAGVYLISKVFKKQVDRVASVSYRINGEWSDPEVRFDKLFDDGAAGREGQSAVAESARRRQQNRQQQSAQHAESAPGQAQLQPEGPESSGEPLEPLPATGPLRQDLAPGGTQPGTGEV